MGASGLKEMYSYWNKNAYFQDMYHIYYIVCTQWMECAIYYLFKFRICFQDFPPSMDVGYTTMCTMDEIFHVQYH